jgi:hypothetical protein
LMFCMDWIGSDDLRISRFGIVDDSLRAPQRGRLAAFYVGPLVRDPKRGRQCELGHGNI